MVGTLLETIDRSLDMIGGGESHIAKKSSQVLELYFQEILVSCMRHWEQQGSEIQSLNWLTSLKHLKKSDQPQWTWALHQAS